MFGPLRSKQLNPLGWKSQISFWTDLIKSWCSRENKPSFRLSDLEKAFQKDGRTPECLQDIISEGRESGVFLESERYLAWLQSRESWSGWITSMSWLATRTLQDKLFTRSSSQLILPSLVEEMASNTLTQLRETKPIMSTEGNIFVSKEAIEESYRDQKEILEFLKCKRLIDTGCVNKVEVVKVSLNNDSQVVLEDGDVVLLKIKQSLQTLDADIEKQQTAIKVAGDEVKQLLKSNSRSSAKNVLRKQKMLENRMQKSFDQKNNLEVLCDELMNVKTNKRVMESYKTGLGELRSKMQDLNSENIDEILSDLRETVEENNGISEALSSDVLGDSLDLEELEKELKDLSDDENDIDPLKSKMPPNDDEKIIEALEKLEVVDLEPQIEITKVNTKKLKEKM